MKNLKPYSDDCFDIHKKAVNKKRAGELKDRLLRLNPSVEVEFQKFLEKFTSNKLASLIPNATLSLSKDDLHSLYSYQSSIIISVRESIRKLQIRTIISTCQNCTIDSANSFDHILPKAVYPEFIVNPKNLFPCCTTCNSHKLDSTDAGNEQKFLNLYLDDLPKEQYLFADVSLDANDDLEFRFYLENVDNKIDTTLFSIIKSHYTKLHLFDRMKIKSIEYISELETKIQTFRHRLTRDEILADLIKAIDDDKAAYGDNHWRCVLELSLLKSHLFINRF